MLGRQRFVISELQRRYGVDVVRRWAAQLIDPESEGGTMADDIDRLADLLDVLLTNPQVNDVLRYNGTKWVNSDSQPIFTKVVHVPASAILSLHDSPFTLIAAPAGAGIYVMYIFAIPDGAGSTPYTIATTLNLIGNVCSGLPDLPGLSTFLQFGSAMISVDAVNQSGYDEIAVLPLPLQLNAPNSNPTGGDFGLDVTIHYLLVDLP